MDTLRQLTDTTRSLKFEQITLEGVCEALERFADLAQLEEGDCNLLCGTLCAKLVESTRHCGRVKQLQAVWNTKLVSQGWVEFRRILLGDDADAAEGRDTHEKSSAASNRVSVNRWRPTEADSRWPAAKHGSWASTTAILRL